MDGGGSQRRVGGWMVVLRGLDSKVFQFDDALEPIGAMLICTYAPYLRSNHDQKSDKNIYRILSWMAVLPLSGFRSTRPRPKIIKYWICTCISENPRSKMGDSVESPGDSKKSYTVIRNR
jgi:hypothetical protein